MMVRLDIDTSELTDLARDLGAAPTRVEERASVVVQRTGHDVVADAQAIVPVDTGLLKNSIGVDFDPDGLGFEAGPTASYAAFVEWGTSRMAPQPYMTPAFDRRIPPAIDALEPIAGNLW